MMKRRSFFGILAGLFAGGATTTLSAAQADTCTTAIVPALVATEKPFLIVDEDLYLAIEEFEARYMAPYLEAMRIAFEKSANEFDRQCLEAYNKCQSRGRLQRSDWAHLDPARLPE